DDEKEEIRIRARAAAAKENKKKAEDAYYKQVLEEERRAFEPDMELVQVVIDLPGFANWILLDNRVYHQGMVYDVPQVVFSTIVEQMSRAWAHEDEIGNPNRKFYVKPQYLGTANYASNPGRSRNIAISPGNENVPNAQLLRAGSLPV